MLSIKQDLLEDIRTLDQERMGIIGLRRENSDLYGYYLDWIIKKESKLIRKYRKKYGIVPLATLVSTNL